MSERTGNPDTRTPGEGRPRSGTTPLLPAQVFGLVLAGGRSSRMGRDKAFVEIEGESLLDRQVRVLGEAGIQRVLVSIRPEWDWSGAGVAIVHDREPDRGPLGGIVAAMRRTPDRSLLVLAVDMPGVGPHFLRELLGRATPDVGAAPRASGRWEPLCAIYPPHTLEAAERHLRGPARSPSALIEELSASGRIAPHPIAPERAAALGSWNQPEDLPDRVRSAPVRDRSGGTTDT